MSLEDEILETWEDINYKFQSIQPSQGFVVSPYAQTSLHGDKSIWVYAHVDCDYKSYALVRVMGTGRFFLCSSSTTGDSIKRLQAETFTTAIVEFALSISDVP